MSPEQPRWVLSGGLASGKTAVRQILASEGVVTIDADNIGHMVIGVDGPAHRDVAERWPTSVRDGKIHRPTLASIVFNDPDELADLERLTHPHIFDMIQARVEQVESTVVVEIPLISHGLGKEWRCIVVDCRDEVRLRRAIERGMDENDARSRIGAQPRRGEWLAVADLVVPNHGQEEDLEETVGQLIASGVVSRSPGTSSVHT